MSLDELDRKLTQVKIMLSVIFIILAGIVLFEARRFDDEQPPLSKHKRMILFHIQKNFIKYHRHTVEDMDAEWLAYHYKMILKSPPNYIRRYYNNGANPEYKQIQILLRK